jgi:hypothetical protein
MVSPTMDKPPVTNLKPICAALALAADDGVMTYLKMMLWLAVWMAGVPLVFSAIIAAIYIFTGPAADPLN